MAVVRTLEMYEGIGAPIIKEIELPLMTIETLEKMFGKQEKDPLFFDKYRVERRHVKFLRDFVDVEILVDRYLYLIACYRK